MYSCYLCYNPSNDCVNLTFPFVDIVLTLTCLHVLNHWFSPAMKIPLCIIIKIYCWFQFINIWLRIFASSISEIPLYIYTYCIYVVLIYVIYSNMLYYTCYIYTYILYICCSYLFVSRIMLILQVLGSIFFLC